MGRQQRSMGLEDLRAQFNLDKTEEDNVAITGPVPTAPYNFVPLNTQLVTSPIESFRESSGTLSDAFKEYLRSETTYSGYFDIEIKNLTPLYIAGPSGMFTNGVHVCIPGSSVRGCLKNIFKIYTSAGFRGGDNPDFTDTHLYFRGLASAYKDFNKYYSDNIRTKVYNKELHREVEKSIAKGGFLVKKGNSFYICPASFESIKTTSDEANQFSNGDVKWDNQVETTAYLYSGKMKSSRTDKKTKKKIDTSKCHYYKIFAPQWNKMMPIDDELLSAYIHDKWRNGLSLLSMEDYEKTNLKNGKGKAIGDFSYVIPCFYVEDDQGQVKHFGAGPYYRIPYKKKISDHVAAGVRADSVDLCDAIFGLKEHWASRVFVEDCYSVNDTPVSLYPEEYHKILLGPKPTSFQLYLESDDKKKAYHWDQQSNLRGYKQYWHRKPDWKGEKVENPDIIKKIAPIKENQVFRGRIRFTRLTALELGALSYFFKLSENDSCVYKLGMGKPLGLGSVKITGTLYLQDETFYKTLFTDGVFSTGNRGINKEEFIPIFEKYMEEELTKKNKNAWKKQQKRLEVLKLMLDPTGISGKQADDWAHHTRYMDVINNPDEKKLANERVVLPTAREVATLRKK